MKDLPRQIRPVWKLWHLAGCLSLLTIHSYPSTLLLGPDGKILSLNQTRRGQPSLRSEGLVKSLDGILPP